MTSLENLEIEYLENISGGGSLDDSSTWANMGDLISFLFPRIYGQSTIYGFMDNTYLQISMQSMNDSINGKTRWY